ncbi:MAG: NUDIX hydrolase [Rhodospirillaceae bacterium]|nr:NUDIX hydrolase [Rhodospirillaceae bacterium]
MDSAAPVRQVTAPANRSQAVMPTKTLRPRDAATLILVRRDGGTPAILMGQRHGSSAFHPNSYVFPGGAVDRGDWQVAAATELKPDTMARLARAATPARARALAIAAVRETFEETGLMLAKPASERRRVPESWRGFLDQGLAPALDELDYIFRAVTPPGRPRRFNARFFMADAAHLRGEVGGDQELGEVRFVPIPEILELNIPAITRRVVGEVSRLLESPPERGVARPVPVFRALHGKFIFGEE